MRGFLLVAATLSLIAIASHVKADCYDLSKGEPHTLMGTLVHAVEPGPPNYADVRQGDLPEPFFLLELEQPICITGDEFADDKRPIHGVQLISTDSTALAMLSLLNSVVTVTLSDPFAAHTGHHHRPLLAYVTDIGDITAEYGTAATTVRAFYYALSEGDGVAAAQYVVPEKRTPGWFSAETLSEFYGNLIEPLELVSLEPGGPDEYLVRYEYGVKSGACNGRAVVTTVTRNGLNMIQGIRELDEC
jgi:hypothetical protein